MLPSVAWPDSRRVATSASRHQGIRLQGHSATLTLGVATQTEREQVAEAWASLRATSMATRSKPKAGARGQQGALSCARLLAV